MRQKLLRELATRLGIEFNTLNLLDTACTHASANVAHDNERLAFVGAELIRCALSMRLYAAEGTLPEISHIVANRDALMTDVALAAVEQQLRMSECFDASEGIKEQMTYSAQLAATLVRAVIGAIAVDQGVEVACQFVDTHVLQPVEHPNVFSTHSPSRKNELQEWCVRFGHPLPVYDLLYKKGLDHAPQFMVLCMVSGHKCGYGAGSSRRAADNASAAMALRHLREGTAFAEIDRIIASRVSSPCTAAATVVAGCSMARSAAAAEAPQTG